MNPYQARPPNQLHQEAPEATPGLPCFSETSVSSEVRSGGSGTAREVLQGQPDAVLRVEPVARGQ